STSLGQRFLVDRSVLSAIVDAAELSPADDVLEVGPGPGVLTAALAARVRSVTAVEVDPRMVALLEETLAEHKNVQVVRADALTVDLLVIAARPITRIVAYLPYQITSPLLERFLADSRRPPLVVVLVQHEVARRMGRRRARDRRGRAVSRAVVLMTPAKVNLTLEVLGPRGDGYHELASVFATVDLRDRVRVAPSRVLDVRIAPAVGAAPGDDL